MNHYTSAYINRAEFSEGNLTVNSCGNYQITQDDFRTYREHGTHDFQLIYLHKGEIIENTSGRRFTDGSILFFPPETKHDYTYSAQKNTDVFWLHFGGKETAAILEKYGLYADHFYDLQNAPNELRSHFRTIIREITIKDAFFKEACLSAFYAILISLYRHTRDKNNRPTVPNAFGKVIEKMYLENTKFDMKTYAESCCLSVSRFAHIFKKTMGMSPHCFYSQIVANKAHDLILNSELNVGEIAETLGFSDIYYFSRFYKKYFGVSPNKHRKT